MVRLRTVPILQCGIQAPATFSFRNSVFRIVSNGFHFPGDEGGMACKSLFCNETFDTLKSLFAHRLSDALMRQRNNFSCIAQEFGLLFIHRLSLTTHRCLLHPPPLVWIKPEPSSSGFFLVLTYGRSSRYNQKLSAIRAAEFDSLPQAGEFPERES
jgi:hypothetical protein